MTDEDVSGVVWTIYTFEGVQPIVLCGCEDDDTLPYQEGIEDLRAPLPAEDDEILATVEWSDADGCFIGRAPGLFVGGCHSLSFDLAHDVMQDVMEQVLEYYAEKEIPLPGHIVLRDGRNLQ